MGLAQAGIRQQVQESRATTVLHPPSSRLTSDPDISAGAALFIAHPRLQFLSHMISLPRQRRRLQMFVSQRPDGKNPFREWLRSLAKAVGARIQLRVQRFELGNLGDHKNVDKGSQAKDIARARNFWRDYLEAKNHGKAT
jgi:putative component of toxin-antitoxin plasmid stabilization module